VRGVDPVALRRRIGYVFQERGLFPHFSVAGNIGITPKTGGHAGRRDSPTRVDELLDLVRLDRAQYRDPLSHELSGRRAPSASASPARSRQGRRSC